jgi:FMN phosphatase YigB (HAD superfamily)
MMNSVKVIMDFDGTLTDEAQQARELSEIAKRMLAEEILEIPLEDVEVLYKEQRQEILDQPHKHHWNVNGLPAT